jgi:hypothetical protein
MQMQRNDRPIAIRRPFARALPGLVALLFVVATALPAQAQQVERYELSGKEIAVYNIAGVAKLQGGSGSEVIVEVRRGGGDAEQLQIETGRINGRETLRVIYPGDRVIYGEMSRGSRTQMRVREDGTFGNTRGSRRVTVAGSGRGLEAFADLIITVPRGVELATYIGVGEINAAGIEASLNLDTHSGTVDVNKVSGDLLVDTGSGRVSVTETRGNLNVDTGSGRVTLTDCQGDEILVDTGSGRVTGNKLLAGSIEIDTGSGGIDIQDVKAEEISLDTGSGSVELGLMSNVRYVNIDTGSGGVTMTVPATLGADVEIDTGSGGITVDVPMEYQRKTRSYVRGLIGDGKGRIIIDTGSGGVRIRKP